MEAFILGHFFDSPPVFNSVERKQFFSLPLLLKGTVADLRTLTNQVCSLAVAGYFKARRKFFARQFHQADIEYIARQIGVSPADVHVGIYSKGTYARHQSIILSYFGCNPFDGSAKRFIASEIATLVRVQYRPKLVLMEALQILKRQKNEIPSYNVLAGLIVTSINHHRSELSAIVEAGLSKTQRASLDALLEKEPKRGRMRVGATASRC